MRRSNLLKSLLLTASIAWLGASGEAAIPVGMSGSGTLTFDSAPAAGDFLTGVLTGTATTYPDPATLDGAVATINSASIVRELPTDGVTPPAQFSGGMRYNTSGRYLQSRPTTDGTNAAGMLLATFQNTSGNPISAFDLTYDFAKFNPPAGADDVVGFRAFYSLDGMPGSWTLIPSLSGTETIGQQFASISLGTPWADGALFYVLWLDDNDNGDTDPSYTIDNLTIAFPGVPPSIVQQPVGTTVAERQIATLSVAASGSPPLTFQWFKDGNPINVGDNATATTPTLTVTNTLPSGRANSVPSDSGMYHVVVTGSAAPPASSVTVQVTVNPDTNAPMFHYARCGDVADQILVVLTEPILPLDGMGGDITDNFSWALEQVSPAGPDLNPDTITYAGGTTITLNFSAGTVPANALYRAKLTGSFPDLAVTPNFLPQDPTMLVNCFSNPIVAITDTWKYLDDDTDPGPTWFDTGFNDGSWLSGVGPFDAKRDQPAAGGHCRVTTLYGLGDVGTCINLTSPVTLTNLVSAHFRKHFSFSGTPETTILRLNGKFDDGAIVYLNGAEVWRLGVPNPSTLASFANRTVGDTDARDTLDLIFPTNNLVVGDNVIAVELHQQALTSSDLTMGLEITELAREAAVVAPTLTITPSGSDVIITWTPGSGTLQYKDSLTDPTWTDVPGGPHPAGGPVTVPASLAHRFYTLRQ